MKPKPPPKPNPGQVLEDVLARIKKKKDARDRLATNRSADSAAGWREKQKEIQYQNYYDQLEQKVRENWIPPQELDRGDMDSMTVVSLTLLPDGRVLKSYIEESSGDPIFDQSVIRAIMKSTPFAPPPIGLTEQTFDLGLRFHSKPRL